MYSGTPQHGQSENYTLHIKDTVLVPKQTILLVFINL